MKTNGSVKNKNRRSLEPASYQTWATPLENSVSTFKNAYGIPPYAIPVQNEPDFVASDSGLASAGVPIIARPCGLFQTVRPSYCPINVHYCKLFRYQASRGAAVKRLAAVYLCVAWILGYPASDEGTRSHLMEGFAALAVFAKQMSDSQKEVPSAQHDHVRPSSNRDELALLSDTGLKDRSEPPPDPR